MRPRSALRLVAHCAAAVVVAAGAWFLGASVWPAVGAGALVGVVGLAWAATEEGRSHRWQPVQEPAYPGRREEVIRLAWALREQKGRVQRIAVERLRAVAAGRLARLRLDLDAPEDRDAVVALLGREAYETLHSRVDGGPPRAAIERCVDALDRLEVSA